MSDAECLALRDAARGLISAGFFDDDVMWRISEEMAALCLAANWWWHRTAGGGGYAGNWSDVPHLMPGEDLLWPAAVSDG